MKRSRSRSDELADAEARLGQLVRTSGSVASAETADDLFLISDDKDTARAVGTLERLAASASDTSVTLALLCLSFEVRADREYWHRFTPAAELAQRTVRRSPPSEQTGLLRGLVVLARAGHAGHAGDTKRAEDILRRLAARSAGYTRHTALTNLGLIQCSRGSLEAAEQNLVKSLEVEADRAVILRGFSRRLFDRLQALTNLSDSTIKFCRQRFGMAPGI